MAGSEDEEERVLVTYNAACCKPDNTHTHTNKHTHTHTDTHKKGHNIDFSRSLQQYRLVNWNDFMIDVVASVVYKKVLIDRFVDSEICDNKRRSIAMESAS